MEDQKLCKDLSHRLGYDLNHNLRYLALKKLILQYGVKELLVIGCGKGVVEFLLPDAIECHSVDIDPKALSAAVYLNAQKRNRNFLSLNLFQLQKNFVDKKFRAILISEVIEHLEEDDKALSIAKNLLHSHGYLFITVPNINRLRNQVRNIIGRNKEYMVEDHLREYTLKEIHRKLVNLGFQILDYEGVYWGFPKDRHVRRLIPPFHPLRLFLSRHFPQIATYFLFTAKQKHPVYQKSRIKEDQNEKRILLATPSFPPAGGGRGIRWNRFIKILDPKGWKFDVLTIDPFMIKNGKTINHSLSSQIRIHRTFPGFLYSLRRRILKPQNDHMGWDNSSLQLNPRGMLKKIYQSIIHPFLIPDDMIEWLPISIGKANQLIKEKKYRLVITSGFPFTSHILGYFLKRRMNVFWIADYGDPWSIRVNKKPTSLRNCINRIIETRLLKKVDRVIVTNNAIKEAFQFTFPFLSEAQIRVIGQGYDPGLYEKSPQNTSDKFRIVYTGIFYNTDIRNHHPFFEALKSLIDLNLETVIAGDIGREDLEFVKSQGLEDIVQFLGLIPHSRAISCQKEGSLLLLIGNASPLQIPGKVFEYFAACRPILCISDTPENPDCQLVEKYNRGVITRNSSGNISNTVRKLHSLWESGNLDKQFNLKREGLEEFTWESRSETMENVIMELLGEKHPV
jgi:glycosyltransferase involved in cell wall biosynthesis/2-polyprenyl-3-methyl-5-hydroxy-6-metoxy-1,4-benzoquinol methylase